MMPEMHKRIPLLLNERRRHYQVIFRKLHERGEDDKGGRSASVADSLRFLAVAEYVVENDVSGFKSKLSESARYQLRLFERFEAGEQLPGYYVVMVSYQALLDTLAGGDFELALSLATHMGGRDALEKQHDHPFDYAMGYTLKWFVLGDREEMAPWAAKFTAVCAQKGNNWFRGYAKMFNAILDQDANRANTGLEALAHDHKRLCTGRGVFRDSEDEVLCVWGLGMANLARREGLEVSAQPPLIPEDLLVAC